MRKIFINLNQTSGGIIPNGWTASIATAYGATGQNKVAIGESIIYNTKQQAWDSIRNNAENLDYETDEIFFNYEKVENFASVEKKVQSI